MANRDSFKVKVWLLLVAIIAALIFIGTLVFTTDEVTADQLSSVSAITYLPIVPGLIAMLVFVRPRTIKRFCYNTKQSSRIVGILFGILLFFAILLIPDSNNYTYYPWPHKWVHVYYNHALLWMHLDQAEERLSYNKKMIRLDKQSGATLYSSGVYLLMDVGTSAKNHTIISASYV